MSFGRSASIERIAASRAIAIFETSLRYRSMLPDLSITMNRAMVPSSRRGGGAGETGSMSSRTLPWYAAERVAGVAAGHEQPAPHVLHVPLERALLIERELGRGDVRHRDAVEAVELLGPGRHDGRRLDLDLHAGVAQRLGQRAALARAALPAPGSGPAP